MNAPIPPDAVAVCCLRVTDITASLSNPRMRFDDAYIAELAESIPAPASPANEAAAPPTPARDPWPFPIQGNA